MMNDLITKHDLENFSFIVKQDLKAFKSDILLCFIGALGVQAVVLTITIFLVW